LGESARRIPSGGLRVFAGRTRRVGPVSVADDAPRSPPARDLGLASFRSLAIVVASRTALGTQ
jgi:hypothetical protein